MSIISDLLTVRCVENLIVIDSTKIEEIIMSSIESDKSLNTNIQYGNSNNRVKPNQA